MHQFADPIPTPEIFAALAASTVAFTTWRGEHEPGVEDDYAKWLRMSAGFEFAAGELESFQVVARRFILYADERMANGRAPVEALAQADARLLAS